MSQIVFQLQSSIIILLMLYGVSLVRRQNRSIFKHTRIMKLVIVWDLLLIIQIELNRGAILKASQALANTLLLNIHVLLAISTVILYALMYTSGNKAYKGISNFGAKHKKIGFITIGMRLLTYITSFLIL